MSEVIKEVKVPAAEGGPLDEIEQQFGPYFIEDGKKVKPNQRAVIANFSEHHKTVFVEEVKSFLRYRTTAGIWENITEHTLKRELGDYLRDLAREKGHAAVGYKINGGLLSSMVGILKGWPSPYGPEKRNPKLFPAANGVLDFTTPTPTVKEYSPDYFFQHGSRFKYDPKAECPEFMAFMRAALPDEDISLIQRYFGSMFLGPNSDHKILVLKGTPGGGKSTLVTILERIIGMENVAYLRTQHLGGRFEFSGFIGKRLLTGKDVPGDTLSLKGAQFLKSLVGGDRLQAEIKYSGKAEVWGKFHVVVACNNSLRIALDQDTDAWRRRLLIVNYNRAKPVQPIHDLAEQLIEKEGDGIFNWMVRGAQEHAVEVAAQGGYALTAEQKSRVESLIGESQSCEEFVNARVQTREGRDIAVQELAEEYFAYCRVRGWKPLAEADANKRMPSIMLEKFQQTKRHDILRDDKAVRGYKGVAFAA